MFPGDSHVKEVRFPTFRDICDGRLTIQADTCYNSALQYRQLPKSIINRGCVLILVNLPKPPDVG